MSKFNFKAVFTYSEDIPEIEKRIFEQAFVATRNNAIELLNPNYEKWNDEYNKVEKVKENGQYKDADNPIYNSFIRRKQQEILDKFNATNKSFVKLYSDENCDIYGRFYSILTKKMVNMHVWLKAV